MVMTSKSTAIFVGIVIVFGSYFTGVVIGRATAPAPRTHVRTVEPPVTHVVPESAIHPEGYAPALPKIGAAPGAQSASIGGLRLIESFEGFGSCPYWDPYGRVWTRGYGETEGIGAGSSCISRQFGERNLASRLRRFYDWAIHGLGVALNQNQFDALDSVLWNLGAGIIGRGTTLGTELRTGRFGSFVSSLLQYDHAGGQVLEGLRLRRIAEARLFSKAAPVAKKSRSQLRHERAVLRVLLERHRCRVAPKFGGGKYHAVCREWKRHGEQIHRELR